MKVLSIFGTRPEAIKMAPVVKELEKYPDSIDSITCVTGQHREMLDQVLSLFDIRPNFDLNLMQPNQTLASLTSKAIMKLTDVISDIKPDITLVQGDTTTAMLGSLASFYQKVPVGHVEAGLRTYDKYSPFPEEINRRLIGVLATYNFAPTETAADALIKEGFPESSIFKTGNTVIDALLMTINGKQNCNLNVPVLADRFILVTAHRRENLGKPLENICMALKIIVSRNSDVEIVYPLHLNPKVHNTAYQMLSDHERIHLIEPLGYEDFANLMNNSYMILTDSGGIQEEAPVLGKPVLVMRNETERSEAVTAGTVKLVGTDIDTIVNEAERLIHSKNEYDRMAKAASPYGDGHAAERIVQIILDKAINSCKT